MKTKINLIAVSLLALAFAFSACSSQPAKKNATTQSGTEKVQYTCTMHPEVIKDDPGKCPICGMDLVKKETTNDKPKN